MEVVLLTQEHCGFCDDAKALLGRLTGEYELAVREVGLDTPEGEALARDTGVLLPPGIVIDGQVVSHGRPSERRLRRELSRRITSR